MQRAEFLELAERFRNATDPREIKRLGEQLGRMVFGQFELPSLVTTSLRNS